MELTFFQSPHYVLPDMVMGKNWYHFSAKEHVEFLTENGFYYNHTEGSHEFYIKRCSDKDYIVQVVISNKEKKRQSRKTMDMSSRHSGISKERYKEWINNQ